MIFGIVWQELIFTVGGFVFFLALLPSIFSKDKPAFATSVVTASFLSLFVVAFASLELWWSAIAQAAGALAWWILTLQSWKK